MFWACASRSSKSGIYSYRHLAEEIMKFELKNADGSELTPEELEPYSEDAVLEEDPNTLLWDGETCESVIVAAADLKSAGR